jgi:hypothetical protein
MGRQILLVETDQTRPVREVAHSTWRFCNLTNFVADVESRASCRCAGSAVLSFWKLPVLDRGSCSGEFLRGVNLVLLAEAWNPMGCR